MIISDKDAISRLTSPGNLINSMKNSRNKAMSLFLRPTEKSEPTSQEEKLVLEDKKENIKLEVVTQFNPFSTDKQVVFPSVNTPEQPTIDKLINNHDNQVKLGLAHDSALDLLTTSITTLAANIDNVKPEKLPAVIAAASKVVDSIRRERNEANKNGSDSEVHYHFYTPQQKKLSDFTVIEVTQ